MVLNALYVINLMYATFDHCQYWIMHMLPITFMKYLSESIPIYR